MREFAIRGFVRFGWETFKKRPWFFIWTFLFISVIAEFSFQINDVESADVVLGDVVLFIGVGIILWIVQTYAKMGRIRFLLKAHDVPESARFKDFWAPHPFWKFVFVNILYGIIILAGFLLLVVPGVIWAIKYQFAPYIMMERNLGVVEALRESGRITKGYKWQLFLFGLVLGLVVLAGFLFFIVGILVAMPIAFFAYAHAYRFLQHRASEVVPEAPVA